jgi:excisionase family DNA binding protein
MHVVRSLLRCYVVLLTVATILGLTVNSAAQGRRKGGVRVRKPVVPVEPSQNQLALNVPEAAWLLNVSVNTVWNLLSNGRLESFVVGRRRLVARSAIELFIQSESRKCVERKREQSWE